MERLGPSVDTTGRLPGQVDLKRSVASRSDSPSKAWSTITVAITRAGIVGHPRTESA